MDDGRRTRATTATNAQKTSVAPRCNGNGEREYESVGVQRGQRIVRKYLRQFAISRESHQRLRRKLDRLRRSYRREYTRLWRPLAENIDLLFVHICIETFERYTRVLCEMNGMTVKKSTRSCSVESLAMGKSLQKLAAVVEEGNVAVPASATMCGVGGSGSDHVTKRLVRGNKTADNVRLMFLPGSREDTIEKDCCKFCSRNIRLRPFTFNSIDYFLFRIREVKVQLNVFL